MFRSLIFIFVLLLSGNCLAQSVDTFRQRLLQPDSLGNGKVQIIEHGDAGTIVSRLRASDAEATVNGYRVRIFFSNGQNAREHAEETLARFRDLFPGIPADMNYKIPDWKVAVGYCASMEEAIILKGRIEGSFSKAYISKENFPVAKMDE